MTSEFDFEAFRSRVEAFGSRLEQSRVELEALSSQFAKIS
jgi:hypothetical protein